MIASDVHGIDIRSLQNDMVETLCAMVRLPSITGNEADMGRFVAEFCRNAGFEVEIVEAVCGRPNVIARYDTGRPGPKLLLNDHLDIVPLGPTRALLRSGPPRQTFDVVGPALPDAVFEQFKTIPPDHCKKVIKIVSQALSQLPDRFHILRLAQQFFHLLQFSGSIGNTRL